MFTKLREFRERRKKIAELDVARRHEAGDFTAIHPDDDPQYQKPEYGRPCACVSRCVCMTGGPRMLCSLGKYLFLWVFMAVGSSIATSIVTINAQQQDLSVPQNDAIADSKDFLGPFQDGTLLAVPAAAVVGGSYVRV